MPERRGPWLSGLIVALLGAVWLVGQVLCGVVSLAVDAVGVVPAGGVGMPITGQR